MSENNSTSARSAPAHPLASHLSQVLVSLQETFADLGIDATRRSESGGLSGLLLGPLEAGVLGMPTSEETRSEATSLISRILERTGTVVPVSLLDDDTRFLYMTSAFARSHPAPDVREVASKVSALISGFRCLDIAVKQDEHGNQLYFESSASATGREYEESQRLILRIGGGNPPPTSAPTPSEAPTTE